MTTETEQNQSTTDELARKEAQRIEEQARQNQVKESTYQTADGQLLIG